MGRTARRAGLPFLVAAMLVAGWAGQPVPAVGQPGDAPAKTLTGRLLVATLDMRDPRFVESVIYVIRHDASGAMGLVVNRPVQAVTLGQLLDRFGMSGATAPGGVLVHWGGPVESGKAFVLHTPDYRTEGTVIVRERVALTGSRKILEAMAGQVGPRRALFALGYAGWAPGQLDAELARGGWLTASADEDVLFDGDHATKWRRATSRRLIDL
jgi:putative transcriptional regulator